MYFFIPNFNTNLCQPVKFCFKFKRFFSVYKSVLLLISKQMYKLMVFCTEFKSFVQKILHAPGRISVFAPVIRVTECLKICGILKQMQYRFAVNIGTLSSFRSIVAINVN